MINSQLSRITFCPLKNKRHMSILLILLTVAYFLLLVPYYTKKYYVYDFSLYLWFPSLNVPAKDGFSTLFIAISRITIPYLTNLIMLLLLSCSIFIFNYLGTAILNKPLTKLLWIIFNYSCGFWYYFYGKLFYELPFTLFNAALSLCILYQIIVNRKNYWTIFFISLGLMFSWKSSNIFILIPILIFIMFFCSEYASSFKNVFNEVSSTKVKKALIDYAKALALIIFGFSLGNYGLYYDFTGTIKGLINNRGTSDFFRYLFIDGAAWDCINSVSFNKGILNIFVVSIILFVLPVLIKKYKYLIISIFISFCFYLFITYFVPGSLWHGFPYGIFVLMFFYVILYELDRISPEKLKSYNLSKNLVLCIVILQFILTYFYYIPLQAGWQKVTDDACTTVETEKDTILDAVEQTTDDLNGTYCIDSALTRVMFTRNNQSVDALYKDSKQYVKIFGERNKGVDTANYIINIKPKELNLISEVVMEKYSKKDVLMFKDYGKFTITVYKNIGV